MFGFSKEVVLKKELLLLLDQQEDYVTSRVLAIKLQTVTSQTIRKILKDLSNMITSLYNQEQLNLQISTKYGIKLTRSGTNFTDIFEKLYTKDIVYEVFHQLMLSRFFSVEDFCKKQKISISKLRRVIRRINDFLIPYECVIKVGKRVSITGKESQIRLLFFMFFYYVHRGITRIKWTEQEIYLAFSRNLCQAFYLTPEKQNIDVLALWLFINLHSQNLGKEIELTFTEEEYQLELPQNDLSKTDWTYILLVMYALDFINFEPELTFEELHQNNIEEVINEWIHLFERHVRLLDREEKKELYIQYYKRLLLERIIPFDDIHTIFKASSQKIVEIEYPYATATFNRLWETFAQRYPHLSTEINRCHFFDACCYFGYPELIMATIYCCWHSNLPLDRLQKMEKIIQRELMKVAKIIFVECHESAVVISTESSHAGILIDPILSKKDLVFLQDEIRTMIERKLSLNSPL